MPQLNIYIPEELAELLQHYRDRLNLSQVCARALRQEVQRMDLASQSGSTAWPGRETEEASPLRSGPPDLARVLARLRGQRERQAAAAGEGADDAARWLEEAATLEDLRRFGEWTPESDPGAIGERGLTDEARFYARFYDRAIRRTRSAEASPWLRRRQEQVAAGGVNPEEYWPAYARGWHRTVAAAWAELKDRLEPAAPEPAAPAQQHESGERPEEASR
jgi:hypothetical protein